MPIQIIEHGQLFSSDYQENTGKNFYCNRCGCYFSATPDTYEQGQGTLACTCPECLNLVIRKDE